MSCQNCPAFLQEELGCHAPAPHPVSLKGVPVEFDRCPLAIQRDLNGTNNAWVRAAVTWFLARENGELAMHLEYNPPHMCLELVDLLGRLRSDKLAAQREEEEASRGL